MTRQDFIERTVSLAYRLAGFAVFNLMDDAAMLSMMFC